MTTFSDLVEKNQKEVNEIFPWDVNELIKQGENIILLDIREESEWASYHIKNSIHVPRGILESACEYNYESTNPVLADARDSAVIVICRSGLRSILACSTLKTLGYKNVKSMKTGLRGWNDYELPLHDVNENIVPVAETDKLINAKLRPEQIHPKEK